MYAFTGDAIAKQHAVAWQVPVSFTEDGTGAMSPSVPADLQARLRGAFTWSGACCMSISGGAMRYGCRSCGCGGCSALVTYGYAGYALSAFAPPCSCAGPEIGGGEDPEVETDSGASLDVRFDKPVVLFEDAYENAPGVTVAKTSTCSRLTITVNGGEHGGVLQLDQANFEQITNAVGTAGSLAPFYLVPSNQTVNLSFDYEGAKASRREKDIALTAVFRENETGDVLAQRRTLTSVKVDMRAKATIPANRRRHIFGPCEETQIMFEPSCMASIANVSDAVPSVGRVSLTKQRDTFNLVVGACAEAFDLELSLNGATLKLPFQVIYPDVALTGTYVRNFMKNDWEVITGEPAPLRHETGVGCFIRVKLHPNYVSFSGLLIEEGIAPATNLVGYLADKTLFPPGTLDHNAKAGACGYVSVVDDNRLENDDAVAFWVGKLPPWGNGSFEFHIPVKWFSNDDLVTNSLNTVVQAMSLTSSGTTTVNKYGVTASRTTNDVWNVVIGGGE